MRRRLLAFVLVAAATTACGASSKAPAPPPAPVPAPRAVLPSGLLIRLEIARSPEERAQGLMYRASIPEDAGMLFLFDRVEPQAFWMKNCHFPQDMVFTLSDGTVVALLENVPPCRADPCPSYPAGAQADTVLELNAGVAGRGGVRVGEKIRFESVPGR